MGYLLTWGGDGWAQRTHLYLHIVPQAFISIKQGKGHSLPNNPSLTRLRVLETGEIDLDMGIDITEEYHRGGLSSHTPYLGVFEVYQTHIHILINRSEASKFVTNFFTSLLRTLHQNDRIVTISLPAMTDARQSDMQSMRQFTLFSSSPGARAAEGVKHTSTARCEEGGFLTVEFVVCDLALWSFNHLLPIRWARFCWTSSTEVLLLFLRSISAAPAQSCHL
eukprot:scaffold15644_cov95-Skeletonema_dohrnii-CCMP3373.AAC.5